MLHVYVAGQIKPQVNLFQPRSITICSNPGQFVSTQVTLIFFCFCGKQKNIFGTFKLPFILPLLFISTLLTSPTIPSLLCQHPSPYSFYLNAYCVSLEPFTFGFPLDSCPDALPLSHGDLDASSTIFQCRVHYWDGQGVDAAKALWHYGAMALWNYGTMEIRCKL